MDAMTPNERAEAVRASIVTDWGGLDPEFRKRIAERAQALERSLRLGPDH